MLSAIFALAMTIVTTQGMAVEAVPNIDVDQGCRDNLSEKKIFREGPYEKQYSDCFDEAQQNYDKIKPKWFVLSDIERQICLRENMSRGVPYSLLLSCVDNMLAVKEKARREAEDAAARRQIPRREFRY